MEKNITDDELVNTTTAAKLLHIPKATLLVYTHQRRLPYFKIGRHNFFKKSDIRAYIQSCRRPALAQK